MLDRLLFYQSIVRLLPNCFQLELIMTMYVQHGYRAYK